ncbi:MAG: methyltransferase domain-containing protein [Gemmatimonadetes bacterium]|nr:methyltransferase domain-containing protein [Gemmatimonadota bacterium]
MTRLGLYYDWLGRFQRLAGLVSRSGDSSLTVHRRLSPDRSDVPEHHVVHERILAAVGSLADPTVIDAGCGLGGTTFYLHDRLGGRYSGITLSPGQRGRAVRAARRRGVDDACRFFVRSYDEDLSDLAPDGADLIVAIESLAHAADPKHAIANLARFLRPGGRLAVVDDVPVAMLPDADADFVGFRDGWACPRVARLGTLLEAFSSAALVLDRDEDLTPRVIQRDADELERLVKVNRWWRRPLGVTPARVVVESLHGGLMLERLYQRGAMEYRLLVARRA